MCNQESQTTVWDTAPNDLRPCSRRLSSFAGAVAACIPQTSVPAPDVAQAPAPRFGNDRSRRRHISRMGWTDIFASSNGRRHSEETDLPALDLLPPPAVFLCFA